MAYMSQEEKAKLAPGIKAACAKYGVKASISVDHHSTLVVTIKSSPIDFIGIYNRVAAAKPGGFREGNPAKDHLQVNQYWYHENYDGKAKEFIKELIEAMKGTRWYDRSDAMTDYFDTSYYMNINVGRWNKPYQLVA